MTLPIHHRIASYDGTDLAYRTWGEPSDRLPLLFFSGIACNDVYWEDLIPLLSGRQAVTWDYPHHGDSGPAEDDSDLGIASLAKHALAVADAARLHRSVCLGHSMGVQVLFEFYRHHPGRTAALIPIAGPFQHTVGHLYGTSVGANILSLFEMGAKAAPQIMNPLWRLAIDARLADPLGRAAGLIGPAPPKVMRRYFEHVATIDPPALFEMFRKGHEHSADDLLEQVDVPVLILHGTRDVMTPFALAEEMARRIPGAKLVGIEGGAHTLPAEDPDLIAKEIGQFLESIAEP